MRTLAEIRAALEYYHDHAEEIDTYLDAEKEARQDLRPAPTGR